jgi:hypothetical protein
MLIPELSGQKKNKKIRKRIKPGQKKIKIEKY